jgi:hypothetical protein
MEDYTKWERKEFPAITPQTPTRDIATEETNRDLQKSIQQLICDVHEESLNPIPPQAEGESVEQWNQRLTVLQLQRMIGAQKRMVSMMGRVALEHERTGRLLINLTWWIVILTIVVVVFTVLLYAKETKHKTEKESASFYIHRC